MQRRRLALAILSALALGVGCKQKADAPPAGAGSDAPRIPAGEVKRGEDACKAYVDQVCACTAPAAADACKLARALPEALRVGLEIAASPDSTRGDVLHANDSVRKTIKECIEQTAKLPSLGC
ncbi:MAG TPA: hypothetical protein VM513_11115 [Kofleriaceae bacterium]|jgi:hypothetical protein|nr:hypothetical protein [Kofleriaceae bacterium]